MTALPADLREKLGAHLPGPPERVAPAGGGCIAEAYRVEAGGEVFFLKWGRDEAAESFEVEAAGLRELQKGARLLQVPEPIAAENRRDGAPGFLLMRWVEQGRATGAFWKKLGRGLAALHRTSAERYGFGHDNRIGRLPQANTWEESWPVFFRARRLEPQVAMARERGRWNADWKAGLEGLYRRLPDLLPVHPDASLLHGDLWSGNVMAAANGVPVLIDPAVYYGHREADLAMSELFGGFDERFYRAYREAWSLDPGYAERRDIYNLYHLVNHLNHFGASYAGAVARVLSRYG